MARHSISRPMPASLLLAAGLLLLPFLPEALAAQETGADGPAPSPEAAVTALFDAMRAADSARARTLFHPEATLARPVEGDDGVTLQRVPLERFLAAIGGAEPGALDERIGPVRVRRDGRLATAWMAYSFVLDGELHHCGVNAFQFYRDAEGWKIFGIADTSRTEGCEAEPGGG